MSLPGTPGRLRTSAVGALGYLAASSLATSALRLASSARGARSFAVLTYHRLGGGDDPFFFGIDPADFRRQMELLARTWNVLPLTEVLARAEDGSLPPLAVAITFDDNYRSVHEHALPILAEYGLAATIFAPTAPLLDGGDRLWYDRVLHAFKHGRRQHEVADVPGLEGGRGHDLAARYRGALRALAWMKRLSESSRQRALGTIENALDPAPLEVEAGHAMGDWEDLRRWRAAGGEVGSHTVTHPILSRLPRQRIRDELVDSRRTLEEELGVAVRTIAYPNGTIEDFDRVVREEVVAAGYDYALSTRVGINGADWRQQRMALARIDATETAARHLMLRLAALKLAA